MNEEKGIPAQLHKVVEKLCDQYCKYPQMYPNEEQQEELEKICEDCPLNILI